MQWEAGVKDGHVACAGFDFFGKGGKCHLFCQRNFIGVGREAIKRWAIKRGKSLKLVQRASGLRVGR